MSDNNLWIDETWIDATQHAMIDHIPAYETFTNDKGKLYKSLARTYGRCAGKVYAERRDGSTDSIGWVFQKNSKYEDTGETYIAETWITVFKREPIKHVTWEVEYA